MKRMLVIDTHTHIGVLPQMTFTGEMALAVMDQAGVDKTIAIRMIDGGGGPFGATTEHNPYNGNDYIADVQKKHPERIIGFAMVDIYDQNTQELGWKPGKSDLIRANHAVEELERCIAKLGLNGLFLHPDFQCYSMSNMRVLTPVLDSLVELQKKTKKRLPVLVHGVGNNVHYVVPEQLGKLAKNYPDLCFLTSQLGWVSLTDSMIDVAREHENIYLELIVTVNILAAKRIVENIGDQRLTLGTDAPWGSYTLGRKMVEEIAPEEKWDSILGGTISKLLQTT